MSGLTAMESAAKIFFSSPRFAVVGASQDTNKFGYKVLAWYHMHSLPVTPINPRTPSITLAGPTSHSYPTVSSASALPSPTTTSLSIITPPPVTKKVLAEAKEAGIQAVWLQPGTFDDEVMAYAMKEFEGKAVGGMEGGTVGGEGWCVLVDGENSLKAAGREWQRGKL